MSKRKYRQTSSAIKLKAVLEALQEKEEVAVIAAKYDVDPRGLREWKVKFIQEGASIFENKTEEKLKEEIKDLKKERGELHKKIGEQTIFQDWFKKKYREVGLKWEDEPPGF